MEKVQEVWQDGQGFGFQGFGLGVLLSVYLLAKHPGDASNWG